MKQSLDPKIVALIIIVVVAVAGVIVWKYASPAGPGSGTYEVIKETDMPPPGEGALPPSPIPGTAGAPGGGQAKGGQ